MSHYTQKQFIGWIRDAVPERFQGQKVLEVGSLDINGSARSFFSGCDYVGIDVGAGPGVDVVCGGQDYDAPEASFDVVCSFEAMEHNPYWKETFANMIRLLKPGGLLLMSCATAGRPEHGTAQQTRRFTADDRDRLGRYFLRNLLSLEALVVMTKVAAGRLR